jgi:hypothetical protein
VTLSYYTEDVLIEQSALLELSKSKISPHHAKAGYNYPTIHLPFALKRGALEVKL